MRAHVRIEADGDGRPVVVKRAEPGLEAERLRRQAVALVRAVHPGVVEVVRTGESPDGAFELVTRHAGGRTLADVRLSPEEVAGVVAALASTVGDLHRIGAVHGRIDASHVVIGDGGRPVLCGFTADDAGSRADDVAAIGELLRSLVGDGEDWEPIPERRGRHGRVRWNGFVRRALLTLADQATADDPQLRPSATALAAALHDAVPGACLVGATATAPPERVSRVPALPLVPVKAAIRVGAAAVGLGLVVAGAAALLRPAPSRPSAGAVATLPSAPPASEPIDVVTCPDAAPPAGPDVDGDGCPDAVAVDAGVVVLHGVRYSVGEAGDALAVGDWDCDGRATVAVLRPTTGEVFVFDGWAAPGDDLTVRPAGRAAGAVAIAAPAGAACGDPLVSGPGGDPVAVVSA